MSRYLKFLYSVYSARLAKDLSLPYLHIFMSVVGSLCFFYFHLIAYSYIVSRFTFSGWSRPQLNILFFSFEIFTYISFYLFWKGFVETVRDINTGRFDQIMVKPISSWWVTFFRGGGLHNFLAVILGSAYLIYSLYSSHIAVTLFGAILFILGLIASLWFLLCFTAIFLSLNFLYGNLPSMSSLGISFQDLYKYPADIFPRSGLIFIIFLIPMTSLVSLPVSLLINRPVPPLLLLIYLLTLVFVSVLAHFTWKFSLRRYSSASS